MRLTSFLIVSCCSLPAQNIAWTELTFPTSPSPRAGSAMVYDSHRDRLVLIGGTDNNGNSAFRETWENDGTTWQLRSQTGPQGSAIWYPAEVIAAAYDSQRQRTVVLQSSPAGNQSETWEWDGSSWSLLSSGTTPSGRTGMAMAFDEARGVTVLFGGKSNSTGHLSDTWEWDGTHWLQRSSGGPSPRQGHALAYDSTRGVVMLFGGRLDVSPYTQFSDTWEWNGLYWAEYFGVSSPSARYAHSMAFDSDRGLTLMRGGRNRSGQIFSDTWAWHGGAWQQLGQFGTNADWTTMAYDPTRGRAVVFGGKNAAGQALDTSLAFASVAALAGVTPYGSGCVGPAGTPTLLPIGGSVPRLGATFRMSLSNLPFGLLNLPIGFFGFDDTQWNGVPLPLALDPLGLTGCQALLAPAGSYVLTNASGTASWDLPIPFLPSMTGTQFFVQGSVLVLGYNPGGMVFSAGLAGVIGA